MKIRTISLYLILASASVLLFRGTSYAQSDSKVEVGYGARCSIAQGQLGGTIKAQDLKTRVYRVQAYQYIHKRLDIFTQRLEHNDQPHAFDLRAQTNQLDASITALAADYESYDAAREAVASLKNCANNQQNFVSLLDTMRAKRQKVNDDISSIDGLLGISVRGNISDLYSKLLVTGTTGVSSE